MKRDNSLVGRTEDLQILVVCAWSGKSRLKLYSKSQNLDVPIKDSTSGNKQTVDPSYEIPGGKPMEMSHGGL